MKTILDAYKLQVVIERLAHQLVENHRDFSQSALIGIQPRGVYFSDRVVHALKQIVPTPLQYGKLDITFYRDDLHSGHGLQTPNQTDIPFSIAHKKLVLIDDVLFTGRTIRSALDALVDFGRPAKVELMTLIDRRFSREVPIQADYTGLTIDTIVSQQVKVRWQEKDGKDEVLLIDQD